MEDRRDRLRALGAMFRQLRKSAGLTGKDLAVLAGVAQPTISRIETGQLLPVPETVERLAEALALDEGARRQLDELLERLRDQVSRLKGGLAGREAANAARLRSARHVRVFQSAVIPSLLQTSEYARLALSLERDVDMGDAAKAAALRVEAQSLLFESGRQFSFVLTEGAVRTWLGSPAMMRGQLDRLAQVSTLPHVSLGIVPWTIETPALPLHGFTLLDGDAGSIDSFTGDLPLTVPAAIEAHSDAFDLFAAVALYGDALRELLRQISTDYEELETRFPI
ncbi:helix-turn-helix transcriptional regulator [Nonomuraea sp. NPDC003804]|uniref:helix-turn-helix domain-containing protein n=1 Tax=Nonomuraea sp. NPDC003804 TaxID=3154547 RepID=UPI0033A53AF4